MSFAMDIAAFGIKTKDKLERTRRSVTLKLFSAVIMDTPVDSGRLRGNWQVSIGSPLLAALERTDPSGAAAIAAVEKAVAESKGEDRVILRNNLPYAYRIEYDGWSHTKAPAGMVRKNLIRFTRLLEQEFKK